MDSWDIRQNILMNQGYAPILGNFDPTKGQQAASALPDASSTWSSSYPITTAAPAASAATSYRYSPRTSTGSRNRYAEIMAQYAQSQPFSFTSMPPSYTGGFTPYTPQAAAPVTRYEEIMAQPAMGGGGADREAPSAWSQMTPAERAAYYAANPTEGKIALGLQDLFGNVTLLGNAAKYFGADGWYDSRLEKQGYDPKQFAYGPPDLRGGTTSDGLGNPLASGGFVQAPGEFGRGGSAPVAPAPTGGFTPYSGALNTTRYYDGMGREISKQQAEQGGSGAVVSNPRSAAEAQDRADAAGSGSRDAGGERGYSGDNSGDNAGWGSRDAGGDGFAQGGHVSMQRLQGPNPEGPDDGYAALKDGEFVINDKAVKKYGIELMNLINSGKISKGKLRGLLEM